MATDRDASLKKAEKLLKQGRLDGAIAEYVRLLEEQPNDWNTRNTLGDLYVRANQIDHAAAQFTRIADHFAEEGFGSRAIALYRKVIKVKPDDEHALIQSAEINAKQGILVDAKAALATVAEQRRRRGDKKGSNDVLIRIARLDPSDLGAQMTAARASAEMGDAAVAAGRYKDLAADLFARDRVSEAIDALAEALHLDPSDPEARNSLMTAYLERGEIEEARKYATTGAHFRTLADQLSAQGQDEDALEALGEAVRLDPGDISARTALVRSYMARGEFERASACLDEKTLGDDSDLMLLAAEVHLRIGRRDTGRDLLRAVLDREPARRDQILKLGCQLAEADEKAAFECIDAATDNAVAARDWTGAAESLQTFVQVAPSHIPAFIRLVDVCVDGELDEPLTAAQAQLAECYLAAGRAFEARVIAEDLLTRRPDDPANVDRLRRALVMLGEANPEAIIAACLHPDPAFDDLDLSEPPADQQPELPPESAAEPGHGWPPAPPAAEPARAWPPAAAVAPPVDDSTPVGGDGGFEEIDLSEALGDMTAKPAAAATNRVPANAPRPAQGTNLSEVFDEFRNEVMREQETSTAAQHYKLALTYVDMGMTEECVKALEVASRSPRFRFQAALLLGRIHRAQGRTSEAIDWFERAAESPASSVDAGRALLYELGQALEDAGETARALAVYLELQADAGDYRDVGARVARLSR